MLKKLIVSFIILLIVCIASLNPKIVKADDWKLQLTDPKDSKTWPDIKAIYFKEDGKNLYIKLESHTNWDLDREGDVIRFYINTNSTTNYQDSDYWISVLGFGGVYMALITSIDTGELFPCDIDFEESKPEGFLTVEKNLIKKRLKSFSFSCYILRLIEGELYWLDVAPNGERMVKYKSSLPPEPPKLSVSPESIDLGVVRVGRELSSEFEVSNNGGGTLKVSISVSNNAINVNPQQFDLSEYETKKIGITIETRNLSPRQYSEKLTITSNGGEAIVNVSFEILKEPELFFEPHEIDFGEIPKGEKASIDIRVGNLNKGPIKVKLSSDVDWLVLSKKDFESEREELKITALTKKLEPDEYQGEIRITSDGGNGKISVSMTVIEALSISVSEVDFGKVFSNKLEVRPKNVYLKNNSSEDALSIAISADSNWIKLNKDAIKIDPKEEEKLEIGIDFSYLKTINKKYNGMITFTYGKGKSELKVKVIVEIVEPPPELNFKLDNNVEKIEGTIIVGEIFESKITIMNKGGGLLKVNASIKEFTLPLKLSKYNIFLKGEESEEITLTLNSEKLEPGKIETSLILDSNGGKVEIPVSIEIKPKPEIKIKLYIGNTTAFIGENSFTLDAPPYIVKGTTFVPIRFISEAFGAKVEWQNIGKGRVIITLKDKKIVLDIGSTVAFINGASFTLLAPPEIKNGRTFVPVRFISEGLGAVVSWNAQYQEVTIIYIP